MQKTSRGSTSADGVADAALVAVERRRPMRQWGFLSGDMRAGLAAAPLALGLSAALSFGLWAAAPFGFALFLIGLEWPDVAMATLVVACALDRFTGRIGGHNVRPDEVAGLVFTTTLLLRAAFERRKASAPVRRSTYHALVRNTLARVPLLLPLLVYCGVNVLATLVSRHEIRRGLGLDLIVLDLAVLYVALVMYLRSTERMMFAVTVWIGAATGEALFGLATYVVHLRTRGVPFGVQIDPATHIAGVYGSLYEANIFGSYMSATLLLALALIIEGAVRRKALLYVAAAAVAVGLVLSETRGAWGATVLGAVALLVLLLLVETHAGRDRRMLTTRFMRAIIVVVVLVCVAALLAPRHVRHDVVVRAQNLFNFTSGSGYGRVRLYQQVLAEWKKHPVFGTGPGSFDYRLPGDVTPQHPWIPNLTLQALHDTGIIGLASLVWLCGAFFVTAVRSLRQATPGPVRPVLAGSIAAILALLVAFQLTPGLILGYGWALLAIGAAATRIAKAQA